MCADCGSQVRLQLREDIGPGAHASATALAFKPVDKDFPAVHAGELENPVAVPGIWVETSTNIGFAFGANYDHRAAIVGERSAQHDYSVLDEVIDERGVLIPERLLAGADRKVALAPCA